jgi:glycerol-3-phosphate acyltransferase PlsY
MGHIFTFYGLLALCAGYLLGSIPFGLVLTKAAGLGDVRNIGSGNIGATNVLRTGHKGLAAATLLLDALKGTVAVLLVYDIALRWVGFDAIAYCHIAGLGAFLGHIYPVWLRFQGGKGVATFIGVLIGMHWPAALWFGIIWIGVALGTRYSSLAALCGTAGVVLYYFVTGWAGLPFVLIRSALVFLTHHANIRRLLEGREGKIGARS